MRVQHRRSTRRGYTLIEVVVVVAIIGVIVALGMPLMSKSRENARLASTARETIGKLQAARQLSVVTRRLNNVQPLAPLVPVVPPIVGPNPPAMPLIVAPPPLPAANNPSDTIVTSEFRVASPTRIEIWSVSESGNQSLAQIVDFLQEDPNSQVTIVAPAAPSTIRFRNGRKDSGSPNQIELYDNVTRKHTFVDVGVSGMRIRN